MGAERYLHWRALSGAGEEHLLIGPSPLGIVARGDISGTRDDGEPFELSYELEIDEQWRLRTAVLAGDGDLALTLSADGAGNWRDADGPRPDLAGCLDIDISATPFTNTLPVRRLTWREGEERRLDVVYVDADTFAVSRQTQSYTSLGTGRWRFATGDGGFSADLTVDADGFVVHYPPLFERVEAP